MADANPGIAAIVAVVWIAILVGASWRLRRRRTHFGAAAMGSVYDMLNEDRRQAVEIIVEQRAEERDPEDRDGNLPDLEQLRKSG